MSLATARLNDIISGIEEEKTTLCYSLGEVLKGRKDSVSVRHYIAHMKGEGTFRDTVRVGEAFAVSGQGFSDAVEIALVGSSSAATGRLTATRRVKVC